MLKEYELIFMKTLHQKLKEKIWGGISVKIHNDEVMVEIIRDNNVDYYFRIKDFSAKFYNGYSTDYAAYEIVEGYKRHIMTRYFR